MTHSNDRAADDEAAIVAVEKQPAPMTPPAVPRHEQSRLMGLAVFRLVSRAELLWISGLVTLLWRVLL